MVSRIQENCIEYPKNELTLQKTTKYKNCYKMYQCTVWLSVKQAVIQK